MGKLHVHIDSIKNLKLGASAGNCGTELYLYVSAATHMVTSAASVYTTKIRNAGLDGVLGFDEVFSLECEVPKVLIETKAFVTAQAMRAGGSPEDWGSVDAKGPDPFVAAAVAALCYPKPFAKNNLFDRISETPKRTPPPTTLPQEQEEAVHRSAFTITLALYHKRSFIRSDILLA